MGFCSRRGRGCLAAALAILALDAGAPAASAEGSAADLLSGPVVTVPSQTSAAAATREVPIAPFEVCVSGATLVLVSGVWLTTPQRCMASIGLTGAAVSA